MALPWSTIDMDFMNLNQAAHGDREFGYIQSRLGVARKTVAGHVESTRSWSSRIAAWARAAVGPRTSCARCGWPGSATTCATSPSPRATRSRRSCGFGVSVNTYGVNDLVAVVDAGRRRRHRQAGHRVRRHLPGRARAAAGRRPARVPALRRPHRAGPARVPRRRRLRRLHHELRGPRRPASAARPRRAAADGRRLRLRRRGRLEDLGAAARHEGDGAGLPGGTSFMEDYTYHLVPGEEKILGAHMLEVCPSITAGTARRSRSTRSASAAARTRSGCVSPPTPGPASSPASSDLGDRFRLTVNEIDVVEPDEELPKLPVACAVWKPRPSTVHLGRGLADGRRARTTPCSPRPSASRCWRTSPR